MIDSNKKRALDLMTIKMLSSDLGKVYGDDDPVSRTLALANVFIKQGDKEAADYLVSSMVSIYKEHHPEMYERVKHLEEA